MQKSFQRDSPSVGITGGPESSAAGMDLLNQELVQSKVNPFGDNMIF